MYRIGWMLVGYAISWWSVWQALHMGVERTALAEVQWERFANCYVGGGQPVFRVKPADEPGLDMAVVNCHPQQKETSPVGIGQPKGKQE